MVWLPHKENIPVSAIIKFVWHFEKIIAQVSEIAPYLDNFQRILILEDFAGRTVVQTDGAIYDILT